MMYVLVEQLTISVLSKKWRGRIYGMGVDRRFNFTAGIMLRW